MIWSCNKEKRLEKRLDGTWNVDKIEWVKTYGGTNGFAVHTGTESNAGTMTFNDNWTGSSSFTVDGEQENLDYSWNNSEDDITI